LWREGRKRGKIIPELKGLLRSKFQVAVLRISGWYGESLHHSCKGELLELIMGRNKEVIILRTGS
jgi:hypothetical protein